MSRAQGSEREYPDPVKAKIIELVPECGELISPFREGFLLPEDTTDFTGVSATDVALYGSMRNRIIAEMRMVRPITLADVLRAISIGMGKDVTRFDVKWNNDCAYFVEFSNTESFKFLAEWNLLKTWDDQTQEVKDFIGKLIGVDN